jgi:hypothetical protein
VFFESLGQRLVFRRGGLRSSISVTCGNHVSPSSCLAATLRMQGNRRCLS